MTGGPSLLDQLQRLLERTYRMRSGLQRVAPFVIGDRGLIRLYPEMLEVRSGTTPDGQGARLLLREIPHGLRAAIYLPDALVDRLERYPPQRGLGEENADGFATLVEELDHLLLVAERSRVARPVSLFELELHANVSKHLVLSRFLAGGRPRLSPRERLWLRHRLFFGQRFVEHDPGVRQRYRDASRWALRLIDRLPAMEPATRLATLRRFHTAPADAKLQLVRDVERN